MGTVTTGPLENQLRTLCLIGINAKVLCYMPTSKESNILDNHTTRSVDTKKNST